MFATGIENSIPTINDGRTRVDQMEVVRPLRALARGLRLRPGNRHPFPALRPAAAHDLLGARQVSTGNSPTSRFADLKRREITPIVDLCHFGVPDWIGNFQNPDFPQLFAAYAGAFAERYPWVQLYTPVNEMFICAVFSAKYGWWNEQMKDDRSFVTALKHIVKANVMAMIEILKRRHDAIFIQIGIVRIFPRRQPRRDRPRRSAQPDALPVARPQLRPAGRQRHVRISAR